jgi:hypothetical protein
MVVVHGNQIDKLPATYKRYLANYIRKAYKLTGTRVRMNSVSLKSIQQKKQQKQKKKPLIENFSHVFTYWPWPGWDRGWVDLTPGIQRGFFL